jgi:hypothetical protein
MNNIEFDFKKNNDFGVILASGFGCPDEFRGAQDTTCHVPMHMSIFDAGC